MEYYEKYKKKIKYLKYHFHCIIERPKINRQNKAAIRKEITKKFS